MNGEGAEGRQPTQAESDQSLRETPPPQSSPPTEPTQPTESSQSTPPPLEQPQ